MTLTEKMLGIFIKLCNEVYIDCNEILKRTPPASAFIGRAFHAPRLLRTCIRSPYQKREKVAPVL